MRAKSIRDLLNDDIKITDLNNPNCNDCNECCSLFTQISEEEYRNLKKYFTKNKVGISKYQNAVKRYYEMARELKGVYLVCPFSDRSKRCTIYNKRPKICKSFHCSKGVREVSLIESNPYTLFDLLKDDIKNEKNLLLFTQKFLGGRSLSEVSAML